MITDDYFWQDAATLGIAAGVGAKIVQNMKEDFNMPSRSASSEVAYSSINTSGARDQHLNDLRSRIIDRLRSEEESLGKVSPRYMGKIPKVDQERINRRIDTLSHNLKTLTGDDYNIRRGYRGIVNTIEGAGIADKNLLHSINSAISFSGKITEVQAAAAQRTTDIGKTIPSGIGTADLQEILTKHFTDSLGTPGDIASEKASNLANSFKGYQIELQGTNLSMQTPSGNKIADIPLTRYQKQDSGLIRTTTRSGTEFSVKSFNPNGKLFSSKNTEMGSLDTLMKQALDPEEWLSVLAKTNGGELTPELIREASGRANKLQTYIGMDALKSPNEKYSAKSQMTSDTVSISDVYAYDDDGKLGIRKLKTVAGKNDLRSETHTLMQNIAREHGVNPLSGISSNALGEIRNLNKERIDTIGFGALERGEDTVNIREFTPLEGVGDSEYLRRLGAKGEDLQRHSVHGIRTHASDELASAFSDLFGSTMTLDDGHMVGNRGKKEMFAIRDRTSLTLGNIGDDTNLRFRMDQLGLSGDILNLTEAERMAKIQSMNIKVTPSDILGTGKSGETVSLKGHYTSGVLRDAIPTAEGLQLIFDTEHIPEEWAKIFSTSSKAGVSLANKRDFRAMATLAHLESTGFIKAKRLNETRHFTEWDEATKKHVTVAKQYSSSVIEVLKGKKKGFLFEDTFDIDHFIDSSRDHEVISAYARSKNVSLISRWKEVGQEDIGKILAGDSGENFMSKFHGKGFEAEALEMHMADTPAKKANIARFMLAQTDKKAAQDILVTVAEAVAVQGDENAMANFNKIKSELLTGDQKLVRSGKETLREAIDTAYTAGNQNESLTRWTSNAGEAIVGAGNTGSVSWLEQASLRMSGIDEGTINAFASSSKKDLYELEQIRRSAFAGNIASGKNAASDVNAFAQVFDVDAHERANFLNNRGFNIPKDRSMLMYSMSESIDGLKSVPIPLRDTDYSGITEYGGNRDVTKTDKLRRKVILNDIKYNDSEGDARTYAKQSLAASVEELKDHTIGMLSGDNDLGKAAMRKTGKYSSILVARPIEGNASRFVKSQEGVKNAVFISEDVARRMYKKAGIDFNMGRHSAGTGTEGVRRLQFNTASFDSDGNVISRSGAKQDLLFQLSREPVQGPLSSLAHEVFIDTSIRDKGNFAFMSKAAQLLNKFAFMDFDSDILRSMASFDLSKTQTNQLKSTTRKIVESASAMSGMQDALAVKNKGGSMKVLSDFNNASDYQGYMTEAGVKGRHRKPIAPEVTKIVNELSESVFREFGSEINVRTMSARELAHNMTESLLKIAHTDTTQYADNPLGAVEELTAAKAEWKAGGDKGKYEKRFRSAINTTFADGIKEMSPRDESRYNTALDDLTKAHLRHGKDISQEGSQVLDFWSGGAAKDFGALSEGISKRAKGGASGPTVDMNVSSSSLEQAAHKFKTRSGDMMSGILDAAQKNKGLMAGAAVAIAGINMISGSSPEQQAGAQPRTSPQPLQPLQDKKAYIRKYKQTENGQSIQATLTTARSNLSPHNLNQVMFGDNISSANVNITDRSGLF
jgi:hypothetical protein